MPILSHLWAILRLRCPRCLKGKVFRGTFEMNDPCPVCGLVFQREEGYFLGSMYVSYLLSTLILVPSFVLGYLLLDDWNPHLVLLLVFLPFLGLVPVVFWYSRVIWMHFDRWVSPSDVSAGAYEKTRQKQDQDRARHGAG
jgi:uncharacterized protein (DUF983 family)